METETKSPDVFPAARALEIYVLITALLVLIILYGAFQRTDGGTLANEIYLRPNSTETSGK